MDFGIILSALDNTHNAHEKWQYHQQQQHQQEPAEGVSSLFNFKCYSASFFLAVRVLFLIIFQLSTLRHPFKDKLYIDYKQIFLIYSVYLSLT